MIGRAMKGVEAMAGMKVKPHGALIMPMLPATPDDANGVRNDWRSFAGWYKLLERLHYTVDVVTLRELDAGTDLRRYPWIVVPDCRDVSDAAVRSLRAYQAGGGRLIAMGRFAERDDRGRLRPATVQIRRAPDLGRMYAGDPVRDTHAGNTPPLFLWKTDTPKSRDTLRRARSLLHRSLGEPALAGAPDNVRAVRWAGPGREALYLVNQGAGPARDVRITMPNAGRGNVRVLADLAPARPISVRRLARSVEVRLPAFGVSCVIVTTRAASPSASPRGAAVPMTRSSTSRALGAPIADLRATAFERRGASAPTLPTSGIYSPQDRGH
jgi:hypothetical protein